MKYLRSNVPFQFVTLFVCLKLVNHLHYEIVTVLCAVFDSAIIAMEKPCQHDFLRTA